MNDQTLHKIKDHNVWRRLAYTALFGLIYSFADMVLIVLIVAQFCFLLFTDEKNEELTRFGNQLSNYLFSVLQFLTFSTEEKPFPFAEWPKTEPSTIDITPEPPAQAPEEVDETEDAEVAETEEAEVPAPPAKKKVSKKKVAKKKTSTRKKATSKKV